MSTTLSKHIRGIEKTVPKAQTGLLIKPDFSGEDASLRNLQFVLNFSHNLQSSLIRGGRPYIISYDVYIYANGDKYDVKSRKGELLHSRASHTYLVQLLHTLKVIA